MVVPRRMLGPCTPRRADKGRTDWMLAVSLSLRCARVRWIGKVEEEEED